jgi:hypothetical protein
LKAGPVGPGSSLETYAAHPPDYWCIMKTDRPSTEHSRAWTTRGPMHRPRAVSGGSSLSARSSLGLDESISAPWHSLAPRLGTKSQPWHSWQEVFKAGSFSFNSKLRKSYSHQAWHISRTDFFGLAVSVQDSNSLMRQSWLVIFTIWPNILRSSERNKTAGSYT